MHRVREGTGRRIGRGGAALWCCVLAAWTGGCANKPGTTQTGFLSDYARLEPVSESRSRFISPRLAEYERFTVDAIEFRAETEALTAEERTELLEHLRAACIGVIEGEGLDVTEGAGPGIARVRIALTDIAKSVWWQKIHPASRFAGAGTGGAAMEGEVLDSLTGEQLAAVVQADAGNQFDLAAFSTAADVKSAIDKWAMDAAKRLRELRAQAE